MDPLDLEFKQILCTIRKHIPHINSNTYLTQCRMWLEKLSNLDEKGNKKLRNVYLAELCKQIKEKKLVTPFNESPPLGELKNIRNHHRVEGNLKCYVKLSDSTNYYAEKKIHRMCSGEPAFSTIDDDDDESWSDLTDESNETFLPQDANHNSRDTPIVKHDVQNIPSSSVADSKKIVAFNLPPKDVQYILEDWKKTIASLQLRITEITNQNAELNCTIQKLNIQLEDEKVKKEQNNEKFSKRLLQIEENHADVITNLNKQKTDEIQEIETSYESKISNMKQVHEEMLNKNRTEIKRLSEIIQDQCLKIMNDVSNLKSQLSNCRCNKKVHILKKCVSKMDKMFQKTEQEYAKEIEYLKQEMENKENALQMKLKIEKAELVAQTKTTQKEQFEEILNSLEIKYIQMLEGHELQIMKMKKRDDETIDYLKGLLDTHQISYEGCIK